MRLAWVIRCALYVSAAAGIALVFAFVRYSATIPNPMALRHKDHGPVVRILARDGSILAERGSSSYIPIDFLPRHLIDAVVATEDRRFFEHWGIDPAGLTRAAFANLRAGRVAQGGSTITQQLAKNLFLNSERTISRKLEEMVLALWLEVRLGKRDVLELYLNRVYFGSGAYGVEAAAQRFFGKSAQHVTLAEAAVLAGLVKAPSKFSPRWNPVLARVRARSVLAKMVEAGYLTWQQAGRASIAQIQFAGHRTQREEAAVDYAVDAILEQLPAVAGAATGEIIVATTIDAALQRRAQALVHDAMLGEGRNVAASQAGLVLLDTDGGIRALVGGRSYAESQFNRALKAKRQPGSAFKTFVYLAAVESGLSPDSIVQDLPILGTGWSPRNEDGKYRGAITMREALAHSVNAVAVRLHLDLGAGKTAAVARRLGISSELREGPSLALGTSEVTLLELTGAYGVLANAGRAIDPHIIRQVRTPAGQVLYERQQERPRVLVARPYVAALNDMLSAVLVSGTGRRAAFPLHAAAGKTGTSQDFRDAWFVGYTAQFVAGVWVGNDDGRSMHRVMGGSLPAKLWRDVMVLAHEGRAPMPLLGTADLPSGAPIAGREGERPLMPREPIGEDFIARALEDEKDAALSLPAQPSRTYVRGWRP